LILEIFKQTVKNGNDSFEKKKEEAWRVLHYTYGTPMKIENRSSEKPV